MGVGREEWKLKGNEVGAICYFEAAEPRWLMGDIEHLPDLCCLARLTLVKLKLPTAKRPHWTWAVILFTADAGRNCGLRAYLGLQRSAHGEGSASRYFR